MEKNKIDFDYLRNKNSKVAKKNTNRFMLLFQKRMKDKKMGMSRYELSKRTGISESTISRFFGKESEISIFNFFKICNALKFNPYLIADENDSREIELTYKIMNDYTNEKTPFK